MLNTIISPLEFKILFPRKFSKKIKNLEKGRNSGIKFKIFFSLLLMRRMQFLHEDS
jgi:hypothetical protein